MDDKTNLEWALGYASRGWKIFPIKPSSKVPLTEHGFKDASSDESIIKGWWSKWPDAGIGLPTGRENNIVVVDIDPRNGGWQSINSLGLNPMDYTPRTSSETGGGGQHWFYLYNGTPSSKYADGIDLKSDGGYVVLPPSIHPSSNPYRWLRDSEVSEDLPEAFRGQKKKTSAKPGLSEKVKKGSRHDFFVRTARNLRGHGLPPEKIYENLKYLNENRTESPVEDAEIQSIAGWTQNVAPDPSPIVVPRGPTDIRDVLKDIPLDHPVMIPPLLRIDQSGVYLVDIDGDGETFVSPEPFIVSRKIIDLEEETEKWEVTYHHDGKWSKIIRPRIIFADPRKLLTLADFSFPVDGINIRQICMAFRVMGMNSKPPLTYSLSSPGWKFAGENTYFVYGTNLIGNKNGEICYIAPDPVTEKAMEGYHKNGSMDGWLDMFDELLNKFPRAASAVYHSLAAPLLKIVGAPNYCVDLFGDTSKGKTTFSKVGASVWGCPDGPKKILRSWDMTRVFSERGPAMACDMPFFLEESQLADRDESHKLLMMIVNGTGRGRGSLVSVQQVRQWNTVLFSTGEKSVAEATTFGGASARTLAYFGSPFGKTPQEQYVKSLELKLIENYGHVGPYFISKLIERKEDWPKIKKRYKDLLGHVMSEMHGAVQSRISTYIAVLWLACELFHDLFEGRFNPDLAPKVIMEQIVAGIKGDMFVEPIWKRAFEDVHGWVAANKNYFKVDTGGQDFSPDPKGECYGIIKDDEICFYKHKVEQFLDLKKYPSASIFRQWKENGLLKVNGTSVTYPVRVNSAMVRMIVVKTP